MRTKALQANAPHTPSRLALSASEGASVTLTTNHGIPYFDSKEKATFTLKYVRSIFGTIGAGLANWYITPNQLSFYLSGITKPDLNRLIYNFIFYTNELSQRRFGHKLWRNRFQHEWCVGGAMLHAHLRTQHEYWHQESIQWYTLIDTDSHGFTPRLAGNGPRKAELPA